MNTGHQTKSSTGFHGYRGVARKINAKGGGRGGMGRGRGRDLCYVSSVLAFYWTHTDLLLSLSPRDRVTGRQPMKTRAGDRYRVGEERKTLRRSRILLSTERGALSHRIGDAACFLSVEKSPVWLLPWCGGDISPLSLSLAGPHGQIKSPRLHALIHLTSFHLSSATGWD